MVVALVVAGSALAVVTYKNGFLGAGGFATTTGYNNRDWNRAAFCGPTSILYKAAVGYYNADMVLMHYSGVVWTNCASGDTAALENNGYFKSRCWNKDTVGGDYVCQTDP